MLGCGGCGLEHNTRYPQWQPYAKCSGQLIPDTRVGSNVAAIREARCPESLESGPFCSAHSALLDKLLLTFSPLSKPLSA